MMIPTAAEIEAIRARDAVEHHPDRVADSGKIHVFGEYLDAAEVGIADRHRLLAALEAMESSVRLADAVRNDCKSILAFLKCVAVEQIRDTHGLDYTTLIDIHIRTMRGELDAAKAENKVLRNCFCIADDETVVSSVEGSILIDNKSGTRRRYFAATDEERKLKEQLDAANRNLGNVLAVIHRDGGDYRAKHGDDKATEDAITEWARLRQELDAVTAERDRLPANMRRA